MALIFKPYRSRNEKQLARSCFDVRTMTWLIPDLTSKTILQKHFLSTNPILEEDSVLRASELWVKLFRKMFPQWKLVSHDFLKSQLTLFLEEHDYSFAKSPNASKTLMTFMHQLLPLIQNDEAEVEVRNWMETQTSSVIRWKHWYELSLQAWSFLKGQKIITGPWCAALLSSHPDLETGWNRQKIICDLGADLNSVEVEILKRLSKSIDVEVLVPDSDWVSRYEKTLNAYYLLKGESFPAFEKLSSLPSPVSCKESALEIERYTTMITEVKSVVSKVRVQLENGIDSENIAILAPDIEVYWPILSQYLDQEGIPVQKKHVIRLQSTPSIELWLSELRLQMGKVQSSDLERTNFGEAQKFEKLSFDRFKKLFQNIYEERDLNRWKPLAESYKNRNPKQVFHLTDFLAWSVAHWPQKFSTEKLSGVIKKIYSESPPGSEMPLKGWMDYLENIVSKDEVSILDSQPKGIYCLNIRESEWLGLEARFFIGLSSEALRNQEKTGLIFSDIQVIGADLGYFLSWPDQAQVEFQTLWTLMQPVPYTHISFSASDFSGKVLAPSLIWLMTAYKNNRDVEELSLPVLSRWDEIQRADLHSLAELRIWNSEHGENLEKSILQDLGEQEPTSFAGDLPWSLSASQIENYLQCPFKFAASKVFGLVDEPDVDLDLDHMSRGKVLHKLFEVLLKDKPNLDWSSSEIDELVSSLPERSQIPLADQRLWVAEKQKYFDLAQKFLDFEKKWRAEFPKTQTVGLEKEIQAIWNPEKRTFQSKGGKGIPFRGFVDRIDKDDQGHGVILDYKSSDMSHRNFGSWIKNNSFQLALYSIILESGFTELEIDQVIGAFYFSAKTLQRDKGFRVGEKCGVLFGEKRNRSALSEESKQSLFLEINGIIADSVDKMLDGRFPAEPEDISICGKCPWDNICRAPHLN